MLMSQYLLEDRYLLSIFFIVIYEVEFYKRLKKHLKPPHF